MVNNWYAVILWRGFAINKCEVKHTQISGRATIQLEASYIYYYCTNKTHQIKPRKHTKRFVIFPLDIKYVWTVFKLNHTFQYTVNINVVWFTSKGKLLLSTFWFWFGAIPRNAQGTLLVLFSEITPGRTQG